MKKVGGNLQKLKLEDLNAELVKYTNASIKNVELFASAHQTINEISLWLVSSVQATSFVRVAELRALQKVGTGYANTLRGISMRLELPEVAELRLQLSNRLEEIKNALNGVKKRAEKLWKTKINTVHDIEELQNEVDELHSIFEGCEGDIDDLLLMRKTLRCYMQVYQQLSNEQLVWNEFNSLTDKIKSEILDAIDENEDESPWDPAETIENFQKLISKDREEKSLSWIKSFEEEITNLENLSAATINSLHDRASRPPAILTGDHRVRLEEINKKVETRLSNLKIDWLIEKYKELTPEMQKQFLSQIAT